jgi:hypothetical protein
MRLGCECCLYESVIMTMPQHSIPQLPEGVRLSSPIPSRVYLSSNAEEDQLRDYDFLGVLLAGVPYESKFARRTVDELLTDMHLKCVEDLSMTEQLVFAHFVLSGGGLCTHMELYGVSLKMDSRVHYAQLNFTRLIQNHQVHSLLLKDFFKRGS